MKFTDLIDENKKKYANILTLILVSAACLSTYYFHIVLNSDVVFTHFFYIPIIIASLYQGRKGLFIAIFLGAVLIITHIINSTKTPFINDVIRSSMFIIVSIIVIRLNEQIFEAEELFKKNEVKYTALFQHVDNGIIIYNAIDNGEDFIIQNLNKTAEEINNIKKEDVIGKSILTVLPNIKEFGLFQVFQNVWKTGIPEYFEPKLYTDKRISNWRRNYVYKLYSGEIVSVSSDATAYMKEEEERRRLISAVEHAGESIFITDKDGVILYVNPSFEKITGYTKEEIIGQNQSILKSGKHNEAFYREIIKGLIRGEKAWRGLIINKKKDETLYSAETTISGIRDNNGQIINYISIKRDVTEEIQLRNQLRHSQKMEALGTLAGGIAHDFNNILFPIIGYTEITMHDLSQDSIEYKNLQGVLKAAQRAKELVNYILTFSRQSRQETLKPLRVHLIIKEVVEFMRASSPSHIQIKRNVNKECSPVMADPTQIHQVLMNLCTNAIHAMQDQSEGTLEIIMSQVKSSSQEFATLPDIIEGSYLKITVKDTGYGIDPLIIERIFEPYFTTKPLGRGTGLGLSVIHGIIKSHNGHITVMSAVGRGTTFNIYLPQIKEHEEIIEQASSIAIETGDEHILVIDDEEDIVDMITQMLKRCGYTVTSTTDTQEAFEFFQQNPKDFDLVITDQTMPHITGIQLSRKIKAIRQDIPVILCTGYSEIMNGDKEQNIDLYLAKPIDISIISKSVRDLLDKKG